MNIGSFVWNVFHRILRFGTIVEREVDDNDWAHFRVAWHEDRVYTQSRDRDYELLGRSEDRLWRADELYPAETTHLAEVIKARDSYLKSNKMVDAAK